MKLVGEQLRKRFGTHAALQDVAFAFEAGMHVCVMGHSGSGKTTLLRAIAGLESLDGGALWLGETRIDALAPERRPTRTVFQTPALFPHLNVLDNVRFVDRLGGASAPAKLDAPSLLARMGLDPDTFGPRHVDALSGGERQRVALARALYRPPAWLLLDEPLSALDRPLRAELRRALAHVRHDAGVGMLHVTHEAADALALADVLVVMSGGCVIASGEPLALYHRPPNLETARLLGELGVGPDGRGWIRPERLRIVAREQGRVHAQLLGRACTGTSWEHELRVEGVSGVLLATAAHAWEGPDACGLQWDDEDLLRL